MARILSASELSGTGTSDLETGSAFPIGAAIVFRDSGSADEAFRSSAAGDRLRPAPSTAAWRDAILTEMTIANAVTIAQPM
jgi:hypothetical protein